MITKMLRGGASFRTIARYAVRVPFSLAVVFRAPFIRQRRSTPQPSVAQRTLGYRTSAVDVPQRGSTGFAAPLRRTPSAYAPRPVPSNPACAARRWAEECNAFGVFGPESQPARAGQSCSCPGREQFATRVRRGRALVLRRVERPVAGAKTATEK